MTTSDHVAADIDRANTLGTTPVVFVHGLWLLPSSWDRWRTLFEETGYVALTPGWPDDPDTVEEAKEHPEVFAHKTVGTYEQFRYGFANAVGEEEAKELYETFSVPGSGAPLFQAATEKNWPPASKPPSTAFSPAPPAPTPASAKMTWPSCAAASPPT